MKIPKYVLDRDGKMRGETTGSFRVCSLEGCRGHRIGVRWPKEPGQKRAHVTFPCTEGLVGVTEDTWRIR